MQNTRVLVSYGKNWTICGISELRNGNIFLYKNIYDSKNKFNTTWVDEQACLKMAAYIMHGLIGYQCVRLEHAVLLLVPIITSSWYFKSPEKGLFAQ